jgi:hypothetical protein
VGPLDDLKEVSMTAAEKVIAAAARHVGVVESPRGSNRGAWIDRWARRWGEWMIGQPWCGSFAAAMYAEAGVDDDGLAHPSTAEICRRARAQGAVTGPMPGGMVVWCGRHVEILVSEVRPGVWRTIGGNTNDSVAWRTRDISGAICVAPIAIRRSAVSQREYWIDDPAARPRRYGPWRLRAWRERAIAGLSPALQRRVRRIRVGGRYAFEIGPRRRYGPWTEKASRDAALRTLERQLGRRLRPYSIPRR